MNVPPNILWHKCYSHIFSTYKDWHSPMSFMVSLCHNFNCMNPRTPTIHMTKISPLIHHIIYLNKNIFMNNSVLSKIKCTNRRYNRNKSNTSTNNYSLLINYSHRMNNSFNLQKYINSYYHLLQNVCDISNANLFTNKQN